MMHLYCTLTHNILQNSLPLLSWLWAASKSRFLVSIPTHWSGVFARAWACSSLESTLPGTSRESLWTMFRHDSSLIKFYKYIHFFAWIWINPRHFLNVVSVLLWISTVWIYLWLAETIVFPRDCWLTKLWQYSQLKALYATLFLLIIKCPISLCSESRTTHNSQSLVFFFLFYRFC